MTMRSFVEWIRPVAAALCDDRDSLMAFVDSAVADFWDQPSSVDGWTNKDILAHLAGGNDQLVQTLLRAVTAGETPDPTSLAPDTDAENAIRISERRAWTIDQLKAELQRGNDEVLGWLSQLRDDHRELRPEGLGMTLGKFFRIVQEEHHDLIHLEQLRTSPNT
jgi:hypothetical protein